MLDSQKIIFREKERNVSGIVRLFAPIRDHSIKVEYSRLNLRFGSRIRVAVNLKRGEKFLNPGGISYKKILDQKGIHAVALIKSPLLIEVLDEIKGFSLFAFIFELRNDLIRDIKNKFDISTSGILIASLFGNRYFLTKETAEIFLDGGIFHILVISGLHITFIGGLVLLCVRKFTRSRFFQFLITTTALWSYSFAVGAETPVVRAALMFSILLFSQVLYRKGTILNALGACVLVILLWRPNDLLNQSFHLTFASLVGIIMVSFPLIEKLRLIGNWSPQSSSPFPPKVSKQLKTFCETLYWSERKWMKTLSENVWDCNLFKSHYSNWLEMRGLQKSLRWAFEGILVTIAAQVFILPFLIVYFHRLSLFAVIINLWASIFIVLQNLTALIALAFSKISSALALPIIKLTEIFNWLMLFLPKILTSYDLAVVRVPIYSGYMKAIYVLYFFPLIFLTIILNRWNPFKDGSKDINKTSRSPFFSRSKIVCLNLFLLTAFFIIIVFHPYNSPKANGKLTVYFLDVGQGDSAFIKFPNGETMLVDGGGRRMFRKRFVEGKDGRQVFFESDTQRIGETVVSEFLWEKGYSKIDYILVTHADADHIQGLVDIAKNFKIRYAFIGIDSKENESFAEFLSVIRKKHINLVRLLRGYHFEVGGVKIEVLNPAPNRLTVKSFSNNNSIVFRLAFGKRKLLFTGDIEKETEKSLMQNISCLKADVVKVAHHGSRTSSTKEFIDSVKAEYAIISVGRRSPFDHPHQEVVKRFQEAGTKVLTTGERGTITISTDGKNLEAQTLHK